MKHWLYLLLAFSLSCMVGCKEDPETELITIQDNNAPPDQVVSAVTKENYINKSYISLLGRKPSSAEMQGGLFRLDQDNASKESRKAFLDDLLQEDEFLRRMHEVARAELLRNVDTAEISLQIYIYTTLLDSPRYQAFRELILVEIDKLQQLQDIPNDLLAGNIDREEMHRRCVYNPIYDEINMGSQNF
ncbi:MAG: hypothetical protein AAGI38_13425, partial [Bacteroidota bacterium]